MCMGISPISNGCHVFAIKINPGISRRATNLLGQRYCTTDNYWDILQMVLQDYQVIKSAVV